MRRQDFTYELPAELIAQRPPARRGDSRLLHLQPDAQLADLRFADLPQLLRAGDLLVLNDTRVIPARVIGNKPSGGRVEILLERILDDRRILAHVHASKPLREAIPIALPGGASARFIARREDLFELQLDCAPLAYFEQQGSTPLPPYIERAVSLEDRERYQTVFAQHAGAVAAPTAGLHFDAAMLERCRALGVEIAQVTLHVGAGTFQSPREDDLERHHMHSERVCVGAQVCAAVERARQRGGRTVAVGTTVVRSLEAAASTGRLTAFDGETRLFIRPGFRCNVVDALLTNFHLPQSTLLMLVCAFGGFAPVMAAYAHAVAQRYRFFSYGDCMFLQRAAPLELGA
jgi:S-adenosylmethionine:tRNA ribosyltransferase-isomerase